MCARGVCACSVCASHVRGHVGASVSTFPTLGIISLACCRLIYITSLRIVSTCAITPYLLCDGCLLRRKHQNQPNCVIGLQTRGNLGAKLLQPDDTGLHLVRSLYILHL